MQKKKSWVEKLHDSKDLPKVEEITGKMSTRWGEGTVVIPAPFEVDIIMKSVPEGKIITINKIRDILAERHEATIGCPITTGIFAWIAANAAEEEKAGGKIDTTPYWRTLKSDGSLNEKYPGGIDQQKFYLEAEGHGIIQRGKRYIVKDYEKKIAKI
ncbi:MAG: MGMT family protein [Actinobacteria bacterium]|nr:MGMT family protein [Actinomycetota bacterium]